MTDEILEAFINVAQYRPLHGGSYMDLHKKLKNEKVILNIQNRDNQCLRWALRATLFTPRGDMRRTSSYPTEDSLDFTGIHFPTPVSQIDRLEGQNPNLAINVFGWEKESVIVHRHEARHYSWVKRLAALLYDQNRHNESKHFYEHCLHG